MQADVLQVLTGEFRIVLCALLGLEDSWQSAGYQSLHEIGAGAIGRRAFDCVEDAETARGASADVDETVAAAESVRNQVDGGGDLRQYIPDSERYCLILVIDECHHSERIELVDMSGLRIAPLGCELV